MHSCAAAFAVGFDPDLAAAPFNKLLDNREAETAAGNLVARLQRLEHLKGAVMEFRCDAGSVVTHDKFGAAFAGYARLQLLFLRRPYRGAPTCI